MGAQVALTLDGVTFAPAGSSQGIARWVDRSGGFGTSFGTVTQKFTTPAKSPVTRMEFDVVMPVVATEDGTCVCTGDVLRTFTAKISVWIPVTSTSAERVNFCDRIQSLVSAGAFTDALENLDPAYG